MSETTDRQNLMILIGLTTGFTNSNMMANTGLRGGLLGYLIFYICSYIIIGVPLFYMEMIVGQFTGKDCIKVWKIRPCFSHVGYVLVAWQILILVQQHQMASFANYYMILSFETPIPFHACGYWADSTCDIMNNNYTVHHRCVKSIETEDYCNGIYTTFPEFQFWRYKLLDLTQDFHIEYRVCISSFIICSLMYICCFKRMVSLKFFLPFLSIYPILGNVLILIGSMTQEGSVKRFSEIMDSTFDIFVTKHRMSLTVLHVIQALKSGTGLVFNWSSTFSFRSPCYSLTIITIVFSMLFTLLSLCTTALMICPYAHQANSYQKNIFVESPLSLFYEKVPLILKMYAYEHFWLFVFYSSNFVLGLRTNIIIYSSLLELVFTRYKVLAKYSEGICMLGLIFLFAMTIPFFGTFGITMLGGGQQRSANLASIFICGLECGTFILLYGIDKLAQDVHFMLGIKPKICIKILWFTSLFTLGYALIQELLHYGYNRIIYPLNFGVFTLLGIFCGTIVVLIIRLVWAWIVGRIREFIQLDRTWGPDSELLQRSRAMFSAQAMTKEYLYRQYQLRAGILERQKVANINV